MNNIPVLQAISLLRRQKDQAAALLQRERIDQDDVSAWHGTTREILMRAFGASHANIGMVLHAGYFSMRFGRPSEQELEDERRANLTKSIRMLDSCIEQLEILAPSPTPANSTDTLAYSSRRVFIVHGHDEGKREAVARLLEKLELEPVVLHEQPNRGKTLIEKFEHNADVSFAVVILTGDDIGKAANDSREPELRARQNVVFELGYFVGSLGRGRVCALYQEGIELPSDWKGVVYIPLDERGAWKMLLAREIKAAGIEVDANRAL
jgi:predicted nucleotide-binding protein